MVGRLSLSHCGKAILELLYDAAMTGTRIMCDTVNLMRENLITGGLWQQNLRSVCSVLGTLLFLSLLLGVLLCNSFLLWQVYRKSV